MHHLNINEAGEACEKCKGDWSNWRHAWTVEVCEGDAVRFGQVDASKGSTVLQIRSSMRYMCIAREVMGDWHRLASVKYKPGGIISVVEALVKELSWERRPGNSGMVNPTSSSALLWVASEAECLCILLQQHISDLLRQVLYHFDQMFR
jgi:hypothetical protein